MVTGVFDERTDTAFPADEAVFFSTQMVTIYQT